MLHDQPIRHLTRLFIRFPVLPSDGWESLRNRLAEELGWADIVFLQAQRLSGNMTSMAIDVRGADPRWGLLLATDSFDLSWNAQTPGDELSFVEFIASARKVLPPLLTQFGVKAHRIASIREGFISESVRATQARPDDLICLPEEVADDEITEWTSRFVSKSIGKLGEHDEVFNRVVVIRRTQGRWPSGGVFDRIRGDLDINTHHSNKDARFDAADVDLFLDESISYLEKLETSIEALVRLEEKG